MISKWYFIFLGLVLVCNLTVRDLHAELTRTNPDKVRVIGRVYAGYPEEYSIIKDLKTDKRKIYGLGDVVNNEFVVFSVEKENIILQANNGKEDFILLKLGSPANGLEYMGRILADTFEYYYRLCDSQERSKREKFDSEFEISAICKNKILLQRDYVEEDPHLRNEYVAVDNVEGPSEVVRLDEKVFSRLKTSQISENEWQIEAKSATEATDNMEKVIDSVVKGIRPNFNLWQTPSITFNTALGAAKLDKNGLLVDSLDAGSFIEKVGLKKGDIIKKVNGEQVNDLIGLYTLFRKIKHDSLPRVTIEIERDNKPIALTYKIKT